MEYIDGESLANIIHRQGAISEKQALRIFKDVLKGLNYANSKGPKMKVRKKYRNPLSNQRTGV